MQLLARCSYIDMKGADVVGKFVRKFHGFITDHHVNRPQFCLWTLVFEEQPRIRFRNKTMYRYMYPTQAQVRGQQKVIFIAVQ